MGLNNLSKLKFCVLVRIKILIFAFVVESVLLANTTRYEACTPGNCGTGPNIRFPFYISGARPDYCGYPGYAVVCNQAKPTYRNSKGQYIIQDIFYENQTFRLVDQEFDNDSCFAPRYNFSFDLSSPEFAPNNAYLLFFYNCSSSFSVGYAKSLVSCASSATNSSFVALVHQDLGLNGNRVACESFVAAPVELEGGYSNQTIENVDYVTLLKDGFKLKWIRSYNCAECQRNGGRCGFENEEIVCYCPDDRNHKKYCYKDNKRIKMVLGLSIGCSLILIIACCCFFIRRHYKKKYASSMLARNISSRSDMEGGSFYFGASVFSYSELKEATNNFDLEKELGDGGFGTVYYGKLRDGREVAVKKLYEHNYRRVEQFMNEIEILTQLRHKNLVSLYGCTSRHSRELLLVYEYIPNGTVADHIHGDRATPGSPTWPTRLSIAIETASALAYLHASDIIHRDVKTNNILLDNSFCVKVADFGLSRLFPTNVTHVSTAPQGTPGYVDPEYHQCYQLTIKSDVYSFGVVLIELISSLPAVDITRHRHEINLANLAITKIQNCEFNELIDQHLGFESDNEVKRMTIAVANLAFQCLQPDKETRPSMKEVLEALKKIQSGKDGSEDREKADDDAGVLKPQTSLDSDEIGLLKNTRLPPSPNSVTDQWTSRSTTPNDSGNGVKFASI